MMFQRFLKKIFIKKLLKKRIESHLAEVTMDKVTTIGILFDEFNIDYSSSIINTIQRFSGNSILIDVLVYHEKKLKNNIHAFPTFSPKDILWDGTIAKTQVQDFVISKYDLLINYYQLDNPLLEWITVLSKSSFKVGFGTVPNKFNHFIIHTPASNFEAFLNTLFDYLKILKKV